MIRKIIIYALIILAGIWFYRKYMAATLESFFQEKSGKVDFMGITAPTLEKVMPTKGDSQ